MSTRVLVTGGAGFVGSQLVDRPIDQGYELTVLDYLTEQVDDDTQDYLYDAAEYVWGDVRDRDHITDLPKRVDVVSHQAGADE